MAEDKKIAQKIFSGPRFSSPREARPFKNLSGNFFVVFIFIALTFFLISHNVLKYNLANIKEVEIAKTSIKVDLALTPEEQMQGLSGRSALREDEGMLFVFDNPGKYLFWMKNMNFSIDIIWIGEDLHIVYIKKDAKPELYLETYGPDKDAKYVLEVNAGFSEKNNLKEGDMVDFVY